MDWFLDWYNSAWQQLSSAIETFLGGFIDLLGKIPEVATHLVGEAETLGVLGAFGTIFYLAMAALIVRIVIHLL